MRTILNSNLDYRKVAKEILGKNDYYSVQKYSSFGCSFIRNWESNRICPKRNCDDKTGWGDFDDYLKDWIVDAENSKSIQWETSGGNLLVVSQEENGCTIEVIGRRHGIPWWVLPDGWMSSIVNYEYLDTQRTDLKPWETAT